MRVPKSEKRLIEFARDLIAECTYSQDTRAAEAASNLAYYEMGSDSGTPSLYNRTGIHIDRTAAYLYAPGEVRYSIGFDATDGEPWLARALVASKYLSREYRRADADVCFSQGVDTSLIKGCAIIKHNWTDEDAIHEGFDPNLVNPEFFGVEREDLARLEDQQAMVHTTYLSKHQLAQMIRGRLDESEIRVALKKLRGDSDSGQKQNWLHQIVLGGTNPITQGTASGARAQVSVSASSRTEFSPEMMADLLRMDELWVVDDERGDYTTIQLIEGMVPLEGRYRHRNLTGVKGLLPFTKICVDPVSGYFWGRSEVGRVKQLQDLLSERMRDIRRLMKLQIKNPKAFIGFSGLTSQKMRAALAPGGFIQEQSPGAKIENLGPTIPEHLFNEVTTLAEMFDEIGGFKPITSGQGESGVRAASHAKTLMRTASPKLRERALRVERDAESSADTTFQLMQAKEARVFMSAEKEQFFLKQMPEDFYIEVDSHSSSPAFIDDAREIAVTLKKLGCIDEADTIRMVHPPGEDQLIAGVTKRAAAKQKMIQEHPEILAPGKKKA
jgi:hypothetical protein